MSQFPDSARHIQVDYQRSCFEAHIAGMGFSPDEQSCLNKIHPAGAPQEKIPPFFSPLLTKSTEQLSRSATIDRANMPYGLASMQGLPNYTKKEWDSAGGEHSNTAQFLHHFFNEYTKSIGQSSNPILYGVEHIKQFFEEYPEGELVICYGPHTFETLDISSLVACIAKATEQFPVASIGPMVRAMFGENVARKLNIHSVAGKNLSRDLDPTQDTNKGRIVIIEPGGTAEANKTTLRGLLQKTRIDKLSKAKIIAFIKTILTGDKTRKIAAQPHAKIGIAYINAPWNTKIELENRQWYSDFLARWNIPAFPISWTDGLELLSRSHKTFLPMTMFCSPVTLITPESKAETIFNAEFVTTLKQAENATLLLLRDMQNFDLWLREGQEPQLGKEKVGKTLDYATSQQASKQHRESLEALQELLKAKESTCLEQHQMILRQLAYYARTHTLSGNERVKLEDLKKLLSGRHTSQLLTHYLSENFFKESSFYSEIQKSLGKYIQLLQQRELIAVEINSLVNVAEQAYLETHISAFTHPNEQYRVPNKPEGLNQFLVNTRWPVEESHLTANETYPGLAPRLIQLATAGMRHKISQAYDYLTSYLPWAEAQPDPLQVIPELTTTHLYEPPSGLPQIANQAQLAARQLKVIEAVIQDRKARNELNHTGALAALTIPEALILFSASWIPGLEGISSALWIQGGLREAYLEWKKDEHSFLVTHGVFVAKLIGILFGGGASSVLGTTLIATQLFEEWGIKGMDPDDPYFPGHLSL